MIGSVVYTKRALAGPRSLISDRAVFRMRMKNAADCLPSDFCPSVLGCLTARDAKPRLLLRFRLPGRHQRRTRLAAASGRHPGFAASGSRGRASTEGNRQARGVAGRQGRVPPAATEDAPPPKATAKRAPPPVARDASPPAATEDAPPPKATAKRTAPPVARDTPPPKPAADSRWLHHQHRRRARSKVTGHATHSQTVETHERARQHRPGHRGRIPRKMRR